MMYYTHIVFSLFFYYLTAGILGLRTDYYILMFVVIGALLPDIDKQGSIISMLSGHLTTAIQKKYGHRTITHSLIFLLIGLIFIFNTDIMAAFTLGILSHIVLDGFTVKGVMLLHPIKRTFYFVPNGILVKTKSKGEFTYFSVFLAMLFITGGVNYIGLTSVVYNIIPGYDGLIHEYYNKCDIKGSNLCYIEGETMGGSFEGYILGIYKGDLIVKGDRYYLINKYNLLSYKIQLLKEAKIYSFRDEFHNENLNIKNFDGLVSIEGQVEGEFYCERYYENEIIRISPERIEAHNALADDLIKAKCNGFVREGYFEYKIRE